MANRRASTWELLWLPATLIVFIAGAVALPRARTPWSNALLWATFGSLWLTFIVSASRLARWVLRRPSDRPAPAGSLREQSRAWRWALWFTIYLVAAQLHPLVPDLSRFELFAAAGAGIVLIEIGLTVFWRRRDAARRRREVADLAREF